MTGTLLSEEQEATIASGELQKLAINALSFYSFIFIWHIYAFPTGSYTLYTHYQLWSNIFFLTKTSKLTYPNAACALQNESTFQYYCIFQALRILFFGELFGF